MLRWMYDASTPPANPPRWYCVGGYAGGDTPHAWTREEWDAQPAPARLPIWTRTNAPDDVQAGRDDAAAFLEALHALAVPAGATVAVDTETVIYRAGYLQGLDAGLGNGKVHPLLNYGSFTYVIQNAATSGGRWAADWLGFNDGGFNVAETELLARHRIVAVQLASDKMLGKGWDASVIEQSVPLWHRAYAG